MGALKPDTSEQFERLWARSEELCDVLRRLPSHLVMRSGMSAKRGKLLEQWDKLEVPGIDDDEPSAEVRKGLEQWIGEAEMLIRYIIRIGDQPAIGPAADEDEEVAFEVIDTLSEAEGISDDWCWPWETKAIATIENKRKIDFKKLTKYGVLGAAAVYCITTWIEED